MPRAKAATLNYKPRITQIPYLTNPERHSLGESYLIVHRRGGKSEGAVVCDLVPSIHWLLSQKQVQIVGRDVRLENPAILYFAETQVQARDIIWPYLVKYLGLFKGAYFNAQRMIVEIPNENLGDKITVYLKAYRDHDRVRGMKAYRIYMDEYALCTREAYEAISPCRMDLAGHVIKFGTPMGRDNILYEDIVRHLEGGGRSVWRFPASKTGVFTDEELAKYRQDLGHEAYAREMECDFSMAFGKTYWGDQISKLYSEQLMPHFNAQWPMVLAADIGVGKSFAAFLGFYVDEHRLLLVDYYTGLDSVSDLKDEITSQWDYSPDYIILPHDHKKTSMGYRSSFTQRDIFRMAFPDAQFILPPKTKQVEADIQQVKENLHLFWYLDPKAKGSDLLLGLRLVKQYGPKVSDANVIMAAVDRKSKANHAADAFRYMAIGLRMKNGKMQRYLGNVARHEEIAIHRFPGWASGSRDPRHGQKW